jgi:hypothetical protein
VTEVGARHPGGQPDATLTEWISLAKRAVRRYSDLCDAFWRSMIADQDINGDQAEQRVGAKGPVLRTRTSYPSTQTVPDVFTNTEWYEDRAYSMFASRFDYFATDRSLIAPGKGYMGMGHGVQEGDHICLLFGTNVPFVLRERECCY